VAGFIGKSTSKVDKVAANSNITTREIFNLFVVCSLGLHFESDRQIVKQEEPLSPYEEDPEAKF
jgi:hypothetical protein